MARDIEADLRSWRECIDDVPATCRWWEMGTRWQISIEAGSSATCEHYLSILERLPVGVEFCGPRQPFPSASLVKAESRGMLGGLFRLDHTFAVAAQAIESLGLDVEAVNRLHRSFRGALRRLHRLTDDLDGAMRAPCWRNTTSNIIKRIIGDINEMVAARDVASLVWHRQWIIEGVPPGAEHATAPLSSTRRAPAATTPKALALPRPIADGKAPAASGTVPPAAPAEKARGGRQTPGSKVIAAALDMQKAGETVSLRSVCERAGVDRGHVRAKYPDAVKAVQTLATPDQPPRRGTRDQRTGDIDAVDDPED